MGYFSHSLKLLVLAIVNDGMLEWMDRGSALVITKEQVRRKELVALPGPSHAHPSMVLALTHGLCFPYHPPTGMPWPFHCCLARRASASLRKRKRAGVKASLCHLSWSGCSRLGRRRGEAESASWEPSKPSRPSQRCSVAQRGGKSKSERLNKNPVCSGHCMLGGT